MTYGELVLGLSFGVLAVAVGWLGYWTVLQRRELDACARTLASMIETWNARPDVVKMAPDPEMPTVPAVEAPPGTESLVRTGSLEWSEWVEAEQRGV